MTTPVDALSVDVLAMVRTHLLAQIPATRIVTRLPDTLATVLPVVRVQRTGGPDDGMALDIPTLTFDCFAADEQSSYSLACKVQAALRVMRGKVINGAVVTHVEKLSGPFWVDYENPAVQRHMLLSQLYVKVD